jgi:hypothetical protein
MDLAAGDEIVMSFDQDLGCLLECLAEWPDGK